MSNLSKNEQERRRYDLLSDVKCRKLTLWHSRTFTPILTHAELEPIMATIGFFLIILGIPKRKQKTMRAFVEYIDGANVELGQNAKKRRTAAAGTTLATVAVTGTQLENIPASFGERIRWREYELRSMSRYTGSNLDLQSRPWPRLPYPELDGLHLASYLAFLAALESYVDPAVVLNLFLIRPIEIPHPGLRSIYKYTNTITLDSELDIGLVYFYRR